jgi:uncharacterized membrane protein
MSRDGLLLVYLIVGLSVAASLVNLREFSDSLFEILIVSIAISLFLSSTMISPYITGSDAHWEYALYEQVAQQRAWQPEVSTSLNTALSVTILPLIVSTVTSLPGVLIFKIVYPLLFSILPLMLYKVYRKFMTPQGSFLSVFVLLSFQATYLEVTTLGRQVIAELVLVMLLWLQLSPTLGKRSTSLLVVLLSFGLVFSHYSLALIYFFLVSSSFVISKISRSSLVSPSSRFKFEPLISSRSIAILLVLATGWYSLVASGGVFQSFIEDINIVMRTLNKFFVPATRPAVVVDALGLYGARPGVSHLISRGTQYLVVFFILLGCVIYICKGKKTKIERMFIPLMMASMGFLLASVVLPNLAFTLNLSRIYHITLLLIAPCFYFGIIQTIGGLERACTFVTGHSIHIPGRRVLPSILLFSYLIFTSGWVWAVTSDVPTSVVLDQQRMINYPSLPVQIQYYSYYTVPQDIAAARWLRSSGDVQLLVCAEYVASYHVLKSYGGYDPGPSLPGCRGDFAHEYVYLSVSNLRLGVGIVTQGFGYYYFSFNNTTPTLLRENRIYSDGAAVYMYRGKFLLLR